MLIALLWGAVGSLPAPGDVWQEHETENFHIVHDATADWAMELGTHLESLAGQFFQQAAVLSVQPLRGLDGRRQLSWYCRTAEVVDVDVDSINIRAVYDSHLHQVNLHWITRESRGRDVEMSRDVVEFVPETLFEDQDLRRSLFLRLSHELAHQLAFDSGLQRRGVQYPFWTVEGLATNFESPDHKLRFLGPNPSRQARLQNIVRGGELTPLKQLAVLTEIRAFPFRKRIDLYAQAWGLFRFLATEHGPGLAAYLEELAALPRGRRCDDTLLEEMLRAFGPVASLEAEWQLWLTQQFAD